MKTEHGSCGYEEVAHTADWALHVWAPDFPQLATTALQGMFALMKPKYPSKTLVFNMIEIIGADQTELLVGFLSDALYLLESQSLVRAKCGVVVKRGHLQAVLTCVKVRSVSKMIKAVTYHNLHIQSTKNGLECTLVFDV